MSACRILILPKEVDSKFRFITVASQRAKQLQNGAKPRVDARSRKPTRIAMQEVLANAVSWEIRTRSSRTTVARSPRSSTPVPTRRPRRHAACIGAYKACEVLRELQRRGRGRARGDDRERHAVRLADDVRGAVAPSRVPRPVRAGRRGDIRHISLADAADLLLVAPATANIARQVRARHRRRRADARCTSRPRRRCWSRPP